MTDYVKAATRASEFLIKYNVCKTPVNPLPILRKLENVEVVTFNELETVSGVDPCSIGFGKCSDSFCMVETKDGNTTYIVAYNDLLPDTVLQQSLAVDLAHIALNHTERNEESKKEAHFFALNLLCPRPLIHLLQVISMRITEDLLANLTGILHQPLVEMRRFQGVAVPARLNRFVSNQFLPFLMNYYEYYRDVKPPDSSAVADFGHYMDNYEE